MESAQIHDLMQIALREAQLATQHGDVPVGALVASMTTGEILSARHNERELTKDPTSHAEILALRDASALRGSWRLDDCALIVTLEPCPMCAGAAIAARVGLLVFGATDPKAGAVGSLYNLLTDPRLNHQVDVIHGVEAEPCGALLLDFFAARRSIQ